MGAVRKGEANPVLTSRAAFLSRDLLVARAALVADDSATRDGQGRLTDGVSLPPLRSPQLRSLPHVVVLPSRLPLGNTAETQTKHHALPSCCQLPTGQSGTAAFQGHTLQESGQALGGS